MSGRITIGDTTVPIDSAVVIGSVWEEHSAWQIDISGAELDAGMAVFNPRLYSEEMKPLSGKEFDSVADVFLESLGDSPWGAFLYFTAHLPIEEAKLSFSNRNGYEADFLLEGRCDINWNESLGFGVPVSASGRTRVSRIDTYGCHDESSARARVGRIIKEASDLNWRPDEDGSHFLLPEK